MTKRIAPFVAAAVLSFAAAPFVVSEESAVELVIAAAMVPLVVATVYAVPWSRLRAWWQAVPPLLYFVIVALLRDNTGGYDSVFTPLVILPIVWFTLHGTRAQVALSLVCLTLTLGIPPLVDPGAYPSEELARALLVTLIAGTLAATGSQLLQAIREREAESRSIVDSAGEAFISIDEAGVIIEWNPQAERDFGWSREEAIGRPLAGTVIPERHRDDHLRGLRRYLDGGESHILGRQLDVTAMRRDGTEFPIELSVTALQTSNGVRFNAFLHDITERRQAERALHDAKERFRRAFDDAAIGMAIVTTEGRWLRANRALAEITGYSQEQLARMAFRDITHPEDLPKDLEALRGLVSGARKRFQTEKRYFHADGHVVWINLNVSAVRDTDGKPIYLISQMQDITERKEAEARLAHQASHDPLTGLPNRTLFEERMALALGRLRRDGVRVTVLFLDLDRFKLINDTRGHDAGDQLLIGVGKRLCDLVQPTDTVSRLGGDEFAILSDQLDEDGAIALAERICEGLPDQIDVNGTPVSTTASIGIRVNRDPAATAGDVLADADLAMYEAKDRGRAGYAFFDRQMRERAQNRLAFEAAELT